MQDVSSTTAARYPDTLDEPTVTRAALLVQETGMDIVDALVHAYRVGGRMVDRQTLDTRVAPFATEDRARQADAAVRFLVASFIMHATQRAKEDASRAGALFSDVIDATLDNMLIPPEFAAHGASLPAQTPDEVLMTEDFATVIWALREAARLHMLESDSD